MRLILLSVLFVSGCCCKKQPETIIYPQGTVIYPGSKKIVETLPPPDMFPRPVDLPDNQLPPAGPPPAFPTGRVKITEVKPIPIYPPVRPELPAFDEPKVKMPEGVIIKAKRETTFKVMLVENPPYNGLPNLGCELGWIW